MQIVVQGRVVDQLAGRAFPLVYALGDFIEIFHAVVHPFDSGEPLVIKGILRQELAHGPFAPLQLCAYLAQTAGQGGCVVVEGFIVQQQRQGAVAMVDLGGDIGQPCQCLFQGGAVFVQHGCDLAHDLVLVAVQIQNELLGIAGQGAHILHDGVHA